MRRREQVNNFDEEQIPFIIEELVKAEKEGRTVAEFPLIFKRESRLNKIFIHYPYELEIKAGRVVVNPWICTYEAGAEADEGDYYRSGKEELYRFEAILDYTLPSNERMTEQQKWKILAEHFDNEIPPINCTAIGEYGKFVKIAGYMIEPIVDWDKSKSTINNPYADNVYRDEVTVMLFREKGEQSLTDNYDSLNVEFEKPEDTEKGYSYSKSLAGFSRDFIVMEEDIDTFHSNLKKMENLGGLLQGSTIQLLSEGTDSIFDMSKQSTALVSVNSSEALQNQKNIVQKGTTQVKAYQLAATRLVRVRSDKAERLMRRQRDAALANINKVKGELARAMGDMKRKVSFLQRFIDCIEIYQGVSVDIYQIKEGKPADEGTKLSLRQLKLYMDEEYGSPVDDGLTDEDLGKFEEWLVEDMANLNQVLPDQLGIVCFQPRRKGKMYRNKKTGKLYRELTEIDEKAYFLIRNGQNLYRVITDKIDVQTALFPYREELGNILKRLHHLKEERMEARRNFSRATISEELEDAENAWFHYHRIILFIQALIERSNVLAPLPNNINIIKGDNTDWIKFVYDNEGVIPERHKRFKEWLQEKNATITKGSLIFVMDGKYSEGKYNLENNINHNAKWDRIDLPKQGLYSVDGKLRKEPIYQKVEVPRVIVEFHSRLHPKDRRYEATHRYYSDNPKDIAEAYVLDDNGERLVEYVDEYDYCFRYMPNNKVWINDGFLGSYQKDRSRKVSVSISESDTFFIHYDAINLNDINYYLNNRIDRKEYHKVVPLLGELKIILEQEREYEKSFVKMVTDMLSLEVGNESIDYSEVIWKAVNWYKNERVMFRRSLNQNDSKAWEQIIQKSRQILRDEHKCKIKTGFNTRDFPLTVDTTDSGVKLVVWGMTKKEFFETIDNEGIAQWSGYFKNVSLKQIRENIRVSFSAKDRAYCHDMGKKTLFYVIKKDGKTNLSIA